MTLKARPTVYAGVRMRSRLEAAFAQELDNDNLVEDWTYEPHAYASPDGQYLPDFIVQWVWGVGCVEVKPPIADLTEALRRMHIIHASESDALLRVATRMDDCPECSGSHWMFPLECWGSIQPCFLCLTRSCEKCSSSEFSRLPIRVEHWGVEQDYECRDCGWTVTSPITWGGSPPQYQAVPTT